MKKLGSFLLAAILCLTLFAGCTGSESSSPSSNTLPSTLIVGLDDTFAPMGFRDTSNNLVGFDIDMANALGKNLGLTIEFRPINWDTKEMELNGKKIDCIWNGMSKTPERVNSMTLSKPYLNNRIVIMTTEGTVINTKEDLKKYKIGTQAKSSALEILQDDPIYNDIKASVKEYGSYDDCLLDMQAGRIQAMIVDEVLANYKNTMLQKPYGISSVNFGEDLYVIGFRKEDTALCAQVEQGLKNLIANGEAATISNKWFGKNIVLNIE